MNRAPTASTYTCCTFRRLRKSLGWSNALRTWLKGRPAAEDQPVLVRSSAAKFPLLCRPWTSDAEVFRDVFLKEAYACLGDAHEPQLAIDCGANVGYASAWLLTRYPSCRLISIEPDGENFALLAKNLAPYGERAQAIQSAVWPRSGGLKLSEVPYRDCRAWAVQVRECQAGEAADVPAIDLNSVLCQSGADRISILKIDIEAAERQLFAENLGWLDRVEHLAIELHDEECQAVFRQAMAGRGFAISRCGELTVCRK